MKVMVTLNKEYKNSLEKAYILYKVEFNRKIENFEVYKFPKILGDFKRSER